MTEPERKRVVRATLRCLVEDLGQEIGPAPLREALRTVVNDIESDPTYMLPCPLIDAEHAVLNKANLIASDEAAQRERIAALNDRHVIKVKTGDRRGALWQDEEGTWWLLAAGRRKNDGGGDFYQTLQRFKHDASPIAPDEIDLRYQRLERAFEQECELERTTQAEVLRAVLTASRNPTSTVEAVAFGAVISAAVFPDEDGLAVLEMSWEFITFDQQERFPMDVLAMVPGREYIEAWDYLPPGKASASPHTWFTYVTNDWVEQMSTSAELDELLSNGDDWRPVNPSSNGSEHFSHYAKGSIVTVAYVTGIEIIALCGASVVAHRDHEKFPVCPSCRENLALLRAAREPKDLQA